MRKLDEYWDSIPVGKQNRKTYAQLGEEWEVSRRTVRLILHQLSEQDNGDGLVLVRSAKTTGFYRTADREEIERYGREVVTRATSHFAPMRKVRRILGENEEQLNIKI